MTTYLNKALENKANPPQSEPLDSTQVKNNAGGFTWLLDDFARLRRFLILGSAGGSYYVGESKLTKENIDVIERCIAQSPQRTISEIYNISVDGRAPKNDQAIFALALCVASGNEEAKRLALSIMPQVCRIGTHLFQFVEFLNQLGHLTGRAKRRALGEWYTEKTADQAAYQAVKYRNRNGWTHRDVLRIAHPKAVDTEHAGLFQWITKGAPETGIRVPFVPKIVEGFERAQASNTSAQTASLVREYNLPREALKTEHLTSPEVWQALLDTGMGLTALIRNLGNMTRIGLLTPTSDATAEVVRRLKQGDELKKARVHPMSILFALKTYASGGGWRSDKNWKPVTKIVDALDGAFYKAFGNVEPTGKRVLLAIDVSGSMTMSMGDTNLMCLEAAAAMALVTQNVEDRVEVVGFTSGHSGSWNSPSSRRYSGYRDGLTPLNISSRQRLDDVVKYMQGLSFGGTDCALPMLYAKDLNREVDTFVIYTDSETWAGGVHPAKALKDYRKASGIDAKLIVVGMVSNGFTIADPKDPGMLDVVGFDTATPNIISEFSSGRI